MTKLLSPILAEVAPGYVQWFCPGCGETHHIPVLSERDPGKAWGWNRDPIRPTFTPSVLVTSGHFVAGWKVEDGCWCQPGPDGEAWGFNCHRCHVFVVEGRIQFLDDCSHHLAGQTIDLPPLPLRNDGTARDTIADSDGDDGS